MQIFESIFPIVAIALLGYGMHRRRIFSESEMAGIERFTFNYLVPCLLFLGTATAEFPESMDWNYFLAFYCAISLIFLAGVLIGRFFYGYGPVAQSVFGMGCAYPNVTILGIPLCLELIGESAFAPMFIIISVHNIYHFALGTLMAERNMTGDRHLLRHLYDVVKGLILNPITGSLLAGGAVNLLNVPIYAPVMDAVSLMSRAAVPAALFSLGAVLTRYRVRGELNSVILMVVINLLALPGLVWVLMFHVFDIEEVWAQTAVILASMPVGISVYVFSRRYQCGEAQAAGGIIVSAVLSVFTISFFAWLIGL